MYSTNKTALLSVDPLFVRALVPLLQENKVDMAMFGHVHNYERTCAMYPGDCKAMPVKEEDGTDTFEKTEYTAPVQAVIGMAGFKLDDFSPIVRKLIRLALSLRKIEGSTTIFLHCAGPKLDFSKDI